MTFIVLQVSDEDNGKYTLKAVNTAGEAKADSMLDVMGKPKPPKVVKEIEPAEVVIPGKRDIKLNCKIAGFPAPTIKWYRDGNEIKVRYQCSLDEKARFARVRAARGWIPAYQGSCIDPMDQSHPLDPT